MTETATLLSYDEDADELPARVIMHDTGEEEVLTKVIFDDEPVTNQIVEIYRDEDVIELKPTERFELQASQVKVHKGFLRLSSDETDEPASVELKGIHEKLNTKLWNQLGWSDQTIAYDSEGNLLYIKGVGGIAKIMAHIDGLLQKAAEEEASRALQAEIAAEEKKKQAAQLLISENKAAKARLVNPYTFVPLPIAEKVPLRSAPSGHKQIKAGHLSGRVQVTWQAQSPIMVGGGKAPATENGQKDASGDTSRFPRRPNGRLMIPGSGVKGAIRSLHETLCGSCFRLVDLDFVPVYRQPVEQLANGGDQGWDVALVLGVDKDGRPTRLALAKGRIGVRDTALIGANWQTGQRFEVDQRGLEKKKNRGEVLLERKYLQRNDDGEWVLLLTDANARHPKKPYWGLLANVGAPHQPTKELTEVIDEAWFLYQRLADGTDDSRRIAGGKPPNLQVDFQGQKLGYRQQVTRHLSKGDVIWVQHRGQAVTAIKRAQAWRIEGTGALRERLPKALWPCGSEDSDRETHTVDINTGKEVPELCPSCAVFGSAAVTEVANRTREAQQHSYRGHVRIGPAVAVDDVKIEEISRAPLSSPRPGSGQFYLEPRDTKPQERKKNQPQDALYSWGSRADTPSLRKIRGRKFYWHGASNRHRLGHDSKNNKTKSNDTLAQNVELAPAGTKFTSEITFDNLTPAALGGLLAAINPALLLGKLDNGGEGGEIWTHLGGGRPLGLGSVTPSLELELHDAASRYGTSETPDFSADQLIQAWIETVPEAVQNTWPSLAAVLSSKRVNATQIRYPTFKFFQNSSGRPLSEERAPMRTLPLAVSADQTMAEDGTHDPGSADEKEG